MGVVERTEDVLRLEVAVVDAQVMAVFHGIQDLKEYALGQFILTDILSSFCDIEEQVTFRAILQDNINAIRVVNNLVHGNNVGVC